MSSPAAAQAPKLKRTPLYHVHRRLGAKMVEFAGWEMPVQYSGVIDEHLAVRSRAGLFDVSHMGEVEVLGAGGFDYCQKLTPNDLARAKPGQAQYNLLLNEQGGAVDDIVVYPLKPGAIFICVNASNTDKDFEWIRSHAPSDVPVENTSARYAQLALQGPAAEKILQPLTPTPLKDVKSFYFFFGDVAGIRSLVARTGYTGEDGFELFCEAEDAEKLWNALLDAGANDGLQPAGLGARDTLRLERALALYGHELDDTTTPLEAGLDWVVKFSKAEFLGRDALLRQKEKGVQRKLVGLELIDPGIARSRYPVFAGGERTGEVTSGTKSPTLGKAVAMAYVGSGHAAPGTEVEVEIRERRARARVVPLPFYRRPQ
ncbi:MAG TPA: glycine cleavage system aminomethyltransferase GcvT [Candidatus Binatia bacterium]